ncbi:PE-PPE domain-containing protein [Mycobacterium sp. ACS4331]|uniref:PE-PPE domain-containing protein n=1 Tax=Mycobacterium sp. ACS4331 TaxID=1834121 RepID=UPI0007FC6B62|nr:PE-PPE domain-containing protein [Mycobacterium sp. ACS4331]OBF28107.1 PE family protein [Mycobacterium sp. ACS4331]
MHVRKLSACASVLAVAGLVATAPIVAAETVFTVGGTGSAMLGDQGPWPLPYTHGAPQVNIGYPSAPVYMDWSVSLGADMLQERMASTPGDKTTVGVSQGALVIAEVKRRLMELPEEDRPGADEVRFIAVADPSNPQGGLFRHLTKGYVLPFFGVTVGGTPDTPWDTIYIVREYDGFADFPDRLGNVVAVANALLGVVYVHAQMSYPDVDLDTVPAEDVTTSTNSLGGVTTTYLVRTERLPLVQPLRDLGVDESFVRELEARLKPIVDAGYVRNDVPRTPAPVAESAPEGDRDAEAASDVAEVEPKRKLLRLARVDRSAAAALSPNRQRVKALRAERRIPDARTAPTSSAPAAGADAGGGPAGPRASRDGSTRSGRDAPADGGEA